MTGIVIRNVTNEDEHDLEDVGARPALPEDVREHEERGEDAHHEDVAVGEVDELDDAVDHRVAERDEGVDGAARQAVDELRRTDEQEVEDRQHADEHAAARGAAAGTFPRDLGVR